MENHLEDELNVFDKKNETNEIQNFWGEKKNKN